MIQESLEQLQQTLQRAAEAFTDDAQALNDLLLTMMEDVQRAMNEPLDIFPVAHHSAASALHIIRRLDERKPKAIYIELCEDMREVVDNLMDCRLPVALQAFASESNIIAAELMPMTVVAPLTEASAEYQAIAYCLQNPETHLVFVDRAVDYVFQWKPAEQPQALDEDEEPPDEAADMHGGALALQSGELMPTFDEFVIYLLRNSNTRHFAEWWDQYVERTILSADYTTYKQVMTLVGSLIRHLGRREQDVVVDELRERYMWTRIKQHMAEHNIAPTEAIHICGAAHAASRVDEFGTLTDAIWEDIPPLSNTNWLFGLIPSSFAAIEHQFGHPAGTVSLTEGAWKKTMTAAKLEPYTFSRDGKPRKRKQLKPVKALQSSDAIFQFMSQPPSFADADRDQLLEWCARIVALARKHGYVSSTADSIAIYETSMLLAKMRNREHPSPYDFVDAAITCLEKDRTPRKNNIAALCKILLGGDRIGTVGYKSLPPLAQNIYDRLAPLEVNLYARQDQRALMDIVSNSELLDASELLWRLNYLLGNHVVQPIMGERKLGYVPIQESWEIRIGRSQNAVIQLGYEGITLEQVMEIRMKKRAYADKATAADAINTAEASVLYLNSPRLTHDLGTHARRLLEQESNVIDARDIFQRIRRLVNHYRSTPNGLPQWIKDFVATGYSHYASLLPQAMPDRGTKPQEIAGMLGFIFTLESLALSLGCSRDQIIISIQQAGQEQIPPEKLGLLWTAEWFLEMRTIDSMRDYLRGVMQNPMQLPTLPQYIQGFVLALSFAPRISVFLVELLSDVFSNVPDQTLIPWLPQLMLILRDHQQELRPLIKEAADIFPQTLDGFATWEPRWLVDVVEKPVKTGVQLDASQASIRAMLVDAPETTNALAALLGVGSTEWNTEVDGELSGELKVVKQLLTDAPDTMGAITNLL